MMNLNKLWLVASLLVLFNFSSSALFAQC